MTPDNLDVLAFVVGVVAVIAVVAAMSPPKRARGHSPPPDGWKPPASVQAPPPKVYPEGKPPRRPPPAGYRPVAHVRDVHVKDGCIHWTETCTVAVPDGVRVRLVDGDGNDVPVLDASKAHQRSSRGAT